MIQITYKINALFKQYQMFRKLKQFFCSIARTNKTEYVEAKIISLTKTCLQRRRICSFSSRLAPTSKYVFFQTN